MGKPTIIKIDNILEGYNSLSKVRDIYSRIRKEILTEDPIQTSPGGLVVANDHGPRRGSYYWGSI